MVDGDIHDEELVEQVCRDHGVTAIIHFAAYKSVGESMESPTKYWRNNVDGTVQLIDAALRAGVRGSCSPHPARCTARQTTCQSPRRADHPESVYAETKATVERILS